jgi:surface antigen/uncharacterized protein YraI
MIGIGKRARGPSRLSALVLAVLCFFAIVPAGRAHAAVVGGSSPAVYGTIKASPTLNVRGGPGVGYNVHGTVAGGSRIHVVCVEWGSSVTATWADGLTYSTEVWDSVADSTGKSVGLYVSDAWVDTGGDTSLMVPSCDYAADPTGSAGYPWPNLDPSVNGQGTDKDPADGHGYQEGQCTSFAAWEIRNDGIYHPHTPDFHGNAQSWVTDSGATVVSTPHVGDIAEWDAGVHGAGGVGHVAYVAAVYPDDNEILVYEYNWTDSWDNYTFLRLSERWVQLGSTGFDGPPSHYLQF